MDPVNLKIKIQEIERTGYVPTRWERKFLKDMKALARDGKFARGRQSDRVEEILNKASNPRARIRPVVVRGYFLLKA